MGRIVGLEIGVVFVFDHFSFYRNQAGFRVGGRHRVIFDMVVIAQVMHMHVVLLNVVVVGVVAVGLRVVRVEDKVADQVVGTDGRQAVHFGF